MRVQDRSVSPSGEPGIDVVIVSHQTRDAVLDCVEAVLAEPGTNVIVVDNASRDGTVAALRERFPDLRVLANDDNRGYGAAANQGARVGGAAHLVLLNGDARPEPGALRAMADHLDAHPEVAVVGPRLVRRDGSLQHSTYPFPSLGDLLVGETGIQLLAARVPPVRERLLRTWSHDRERAAPWIVGAAMAFRRSAFDAVGGFDEGYFMYSEEVDLCRRLGERGHAVHFLPSATVTHIGEASAKQEAERMQRERQVSAVRYLRIHEDRSAANRLLLAHRTITLARAGRDLLVALVARGDRRARLASAGARWRLFREGDLWRA